MPGLRAIEKEAYRWADEGIDSMERAAAYMQEQNLRASRLGVLTEALDVHGRRLTPAEERYLLSWIGMGFSDDCIRLAYEKSCENTGERNWKYMNGILERWNQQHLYTLDEIRQFDRKPAAKSNAGYQRHGEALSPQMQEAVNRMLAQQEE